MLPWGVGEPLRLIKGVNVPWFQGLGVVDGVVVELSNTDIGAL